MNNICPLNLRKNFFIKRIYLNNRHNEEMNSAKRNSSLNKSNYSNSKTKNKQIKNANKTFYMLNKDKILGYAIDINNNNLNPLTIKKQSSLINYKKNNKISLINNFFNYKNNNHSKENMESVEWMYYNNLSKNFLLNHHKKKIEKVNIEYNTIKANFKSKNNIKKKVAFPSIFKYNKNINSRKNEENNQNNKIIFDKKNYPNIPNFKFASPKKLDINDNNNIKKRKILHFYFSSKNGSHHGKKKINQDCCLFIPKINSSEDIILFGVFNGHGPSGDKLSQEIKEYFYNFFNNNNIYISSSNDKNNLILNSQSLIILDNNHKRNKRASKFNLITNIINSKKNKKIIDTYDCMKKNNFSKIYESFNNIDKILHEKYSENKMCDDTGTSLNLLIFFNSKVNNKIISTNLGNTKSILITDDKKIKELNIMHTPCIKEERLRIEKNGGIIDRIDWLKVGPLRIWYKGKKYPGLTITRSLGDFEASSLGVISIPDIKEYDIDEEKIKILVIGTNSIWEFLTNDKIMDITWQFYGNEDAQGATEKILETADKMWKIKNENNIPDLTLGVFFFK